MEEFAQRLAREKAGEALEIRTGPLFCALVPRPVWETVGELDEGFLVGMFEDDDFSLRIRRAGLRVLAAEDCFVHHFGQGSFAKLSKERYQRVFEENRAYFEKKWDTKWVPHQQRPGVVAPWEERRFTPREFVGELGD